MWDPWCDIAGCYAAVCLCSYCFYCCSCYRRLSDEVMKDFSPHSQWHIAQLCVHCIPSIRSLQKSIPVFLLLPRLETMETKLT